MTLDALFRELFQVAAGVHDSVAVAVSGGGDSMALLELAARHGPPAGVRIHAVTVDHGLRAEAAQEAAMVAGFCAAHDVPHVTLRWTGWDGSGNLQAEARAARYRLIGDWARGQGIGQVMLAHTRDDVAETFLIRLGRASGLDGLAHMAPVFRRHGVLWSRPLLRHDRETLRNHLRSREIPWIEDPSNADDRFARVRARQALAALAPLGIDAASIARSAWALLSAREALERQAAAVWGAVTLDRGDLILPAHPDPEIARRLLLAALRMVGGQDHPPRQSALDDLEWRLAEAGRHTLAGCLVRQRGDTIRVAREYQAVKGLVVPAGQVWDRWQVDGPAEPGMEIRALGEGIRRCDWRITGLPRASLMAGPAVWRGAALVAAPLAGLANGWTAELRPSFAIAPFAH